LRKIVSVEEMKAELLRKGEPTFAKHILNDLRKAKSQKPKPFVGEKVSVQK